MVQFNEIEKYYSSTFIPLSHVGNAEMWVENNIDYGRCSTFSKFCLNQIKILTVGKDIKSKNYGKAHKV